MKNTNRRLWAIMIAAGSILLLPLIAMQFSKEVQWSLFDFALAGILLFGTGLLCELVLRKFKTSIQRIVLCILALAVMLLIWAELAVGVFGTPLAGS